MTLEVFVERELNGIAPEGFMEKEAAGWDVCLFRGKVVLTYEEKPAPEAIKTNSHIKLKTFGVTVQPHDALCEQQVRLPHYNAELANFVVGDTVVLLGHTPKGKNDPEAYINQHGGWRYILNLDTRIYYFLGKGLEGGNATYEHSSLEKHKDVGLLAYLKYTLFTKQSSWYGQTYDPTDPYIPYWSVLWDIAVLDSHECYGGEWVPHPDSGYEYWSVRTKEEVLLERPNWRADMYLELRDKYDRSDKPKGWGYFI